MAGIQAGLGGMHSYRRKSLYVADLGLFGLNHTAYGPTIQKSRYPQFLDKAAFNIRKLKNQIETGLKCTTAIRYPKVIADMFKLISESEGEDASISAKNNKRI